jgi:hypothetical protein
MKRVVFLILMVALAFWIIARARREHERMRFNRPVEAYRSGPHLGPGHGGRRAAAETQEQLAKKLAEAKAALADARHEIKTALGEARHEVRTAIANARQVLAAAGQDLDAAHGETIAARGQSPGREDVEGIPVPVITGTRVTDAVAEPPVPAHVSGAASLPKPDFQAEKAETTPTLSQVQPPTRSIEGRISATQERAKYDAYLMLANDVRHWLDPQVPESWAPPVQLLQAMVLKTDIKGVPRDYGTMYVAKLTYDAAPSRREALVATYNHELVRNRMMMLGGALTFILIALGAVSGYIRADEATKGYYTNRLRLLAAAGVGAGGVIIYQMLR